MEAAPVVEALMKAGPLGVMVASLLLFTIFGLPKVKEVIEVWTTASRERAEMEATKAAERDAERHRALSDLAKSHEAAVSTMVGGFERSLDRLEKQHDRLDNRVESIRADVHALRADVHNIASKSTAEHAAVPPPVEPLKR